MFAMVTQITQETGVGIGLVVSIVGGAVWFGVLLTKINARLRKLEGDIYTKSEAAEHALRLAIANPGHRVPDPRNPDTFLPVVEASSCPPKVDMSK